MCEGNHSVLDRMEDVVEVEGMKAVISVTFSQAIERRQQIEDQLKIALADNGKCFEKLCSLAEKKQLCRQAKSAQPPPRIDSDLFKMQKSKSKGSEFDGINGTNLLQINRRYFIRSIGFGYLFNFSFSTSKDRKKTWWFVFSYVFTCRTECCCSG